MASLYSHTYVLHYRKNSSTKIFKGNKEAPQSTPFPSPSKEKEIIEWDGFYNAVDACLDDAEKEAPNKDNVDNADSDDDESMKESAIDLSGSLSLADDSEDSDSD